MLRALGNERRLMILCKLVEWGEANVGALAEAVGLSQSALSQHLAKMREEGIVAFRRDSQTIWYRIDDPRTEQLLATLHRLFCRPLHRNQQQERSIDMTLRTIGPHEAKRLIDDGAILVDIREGDEHARERIPGVRHLALSKLDEADLAAHRGRAVIFHCRSGARTQSNAANLAAKVDESCEAFLLEGGLEGWRKAGLPTVIDRRQPIELQRQVQIGAGGLAFLGTLLGLLVSPWFLAVPLFVGGGLLLAGLTGFLRHGAAAATGALEPGRHQRRRHAGAQSRVNVTCRGGSSRTCSASGPAWSSAFRSASSAAADRSWRCRC